MVHDDVNTISTQRSPDAPGWIFLLVINSFLFVNCAVLFSGSYMDILLGNVITTNVPLENWSRRGVDSIATVKVRYIGPNQSDDRSKVISEVSTLVKGYLNNSSETMRMEGLSNLLASGTSLWNQGTIIIEDLPLCKETPPFMETRILLGLFILFFVIEAFLSFSVCRIFGRKLPTLTKGIMNGLIFWPVASISYVLSDSFAEAISFRTTYSYSSTAPLLFGASSVFVVNLRVLIHRLNENRSSIFSIGPFQQLAEYLASIVAILFPLFAFFFCLGK